MKITKTTWKHIRRSPYQSLVAVLSMFITILLTGFFVLATLGSMSVLKFFESKPQLMVFFNDKATEEQVANVKKILTESGKIESTKFISKEDALKFYKDQNKNDPLLLEMVSSDILPSSLEVNAKDPSMLKDLESLVKGVNGVELIDYQKDVVDSLISWTNTIRISGAILGGILTVNSILTIMTVIGMRIATKKDEIEILKLIGASPSYIRSPFVLEGGLYGVVGGVLSWLVLGMVMIILRQPIMSFLGIVPDIALIFSSVTSQAFLLFELIVFGSLSLFGFLLGSLGGIVSVNRYLR